MNLGDRYALRWSAPHLLQATIVDFTKDHVVCDVTHLCPIECSMWEFKNTLPLGGRCKLDYRSFGDGTWVEMAPADAIALPGSVSQVKSYRTAKPSQAPRRVHYADGWRGLVQLAHDQQRGDKS